MSVAVVTMGYNEPDFLPLWARHYAAQVGPENCYFIDHGSDDGSTAIAPSGINIVRIPRSPYESPRCARFMSNFCSSLLEWHDCVLHTDVDEMVFADPARYANLAEYGAACDHDAVTAIGFNVVHTAEEPSIDPARNILEQRSWMYFTAAMAKPVLTRRPIVWHEGFHRAEDIETTFDDLYLLHLRFFDRTIGLRRLMKTRAMPWADPEDGWWQRVDDDQCLQMFDRYDHLHKNEDVLVERESPEVVSALAQALGSSTDPELPPEFKINFEVEELWPIPERFRTTF